ncbi:MAG: cobalamin-dependent protein [Candidatus Omnitrophota bacterium]
MKIFLIFARKFQKESYSYPIGIMSLAAILRRNEYNDIKLFDMAIDSMEFIIESCLKDKPDLVGLSSDSISFENGTKLVKKIQERYKKTIYVLGGVHPTIAPEEALRELGADIAVIGEGEVSFLELVKKIDKGEDYIDVNGIAYLREDKFFENRPRDFINNLDDIPFPARNLLPMEKYLNVPPDIPMLYPAMTIMAGRGCRSNCIYCQPICRKLFGSKMRVRSVGNVIEEIEFLRMNYRFRTLCFIDDEFFYNGVPWIEELCSSILDKKIKIRWTCIGRVDHIEAKLIKKMKRGRMFFNSFWSRIRLR